MILPDSALGAVGDEVPAPADSRGDAGPFPPVQNRFCCASKFRSVHHGNRGFVAEIVRSLDGKGDLCEGEDLGVWRHWSTAKQEPHHPGPATGSI
jgi:hypothetical protein